MCVWVSLYVGMYVFRETCSDGRLTNCGKNIRGNKKKNLSTFWPSVSGLLSHKQNNTANDNYNIWSKIVFRDNATIRYSHQIKLFI